MDRAETSRHYSVEEVAAYLDGEWDEECETALTEHLRGCPECRRRAASLARLDDLIDWHESLPQPNWQETYRPHELWPEPEGWHPSYLDHDHERPGWEARKAAWNTLRTILTDAIARAV